MLLIKPFKNLLLMTRIPHFRGDEDIFSLDNAFVNGPSDAVARFFFVSVIVGTIEQSVTRLDGLDVAKK